MAGKRQHYLPQFLQRGFASNTEGRKTWLYRKNVDPREVGFRDVGVEANFYNINADPFVDNLITEIEREEFAGIVEHARAALGYRIDESDTIAALVAHLEVRSRHLRSAFEQLSRAAWDDMLGYFDKPRIAAAVIREHLRRNPAQLSSTIFRGLKSKGLPTQIAATHAKQAIKMISAMPDEALIASFWAPLKPIIRRTLESRMESSIKQAHNERLAQSVAPDIRAERYRILRFSVVKVDSNDLILGDAAVLFQVAAVTKWKPFLDKNDDLIALYLPVSSGRLIVGGINEPAVDSSIVRHQIATTSHAFFISAQLSATNSELSKHIGTAALPLTESDMRSISREAIAGFLPQGFNVD